MFTIALLSYLAMAPKQKQMVLCFTPAPQLPTLRNEGAIVVSRVEPAAPPECRCGLVGEMPLRRCAAKQCALCFIWLHPGCLESCQLGDGKCLFCPV